MIRKVIGEIYKSGIWLTIQGAYMILTDPTWFWRVMGLIVLFTGLFETDKYITETSGDTSEKRTENQE